MFDVSLQVSLMHVAFNLCFADISDCYVSDTQLYRQIHQYTQAQTYRRHQNDINRSDLKVKMELNSSWNQISYLYLFFVFVSAA